MPVTPYGAFNLTATDRFGNTIPNAAVSVYDEPAGTVLSSLYTDRAGTTPLTNPLTTDANGFVRFYAAPGYYKATVSGRGTETTWRDIEVGGTSAALDAATNLVRPWAAARVLDGDEGVGIDFTRRSFVVMDYAGTLIAAGKPEDYLTFARASVGTYVDAQGIVRSAASGEMRYTHDPKTGAALGLLHEAARTNLVRASSDITGTGWTGVGYSVTTPGAANPDGVAGAQAATEDTSNGPHGVWATDSTANCTQAHTVSVWLRNNGRNRARIFAYQNGSTDNRFECYVTLSGDGTVDTTGAAGNGSFISAKVTRYPSGWYRVQLTGIPNTATGTGVGLQVRFIDASSGTNGTYTGDGTSGMYIWGAQIEASYGATSLIVTTGAAAARAADLVTLNTATFPHSRTALSLGIKLRTNFIDAGATTIPLIVRENSVNNNSVSIRWGATGTMFLRQYSGASNEGDIGVGTLTADTSTVIIGSSRRNQMEARSTVATGTEDTSAATPTADFTFCSIGSHNGGNQMSGTIAKVFVKTRISTQTEMAALIAAL